MHMITFPAKTCAHNELEVLQSQRVTFLGLQVFKKVLSKHSHFEVDISQAVL